jgi:hypothetical protein
MATQITEPTERSHEPNKPRTPWVLLLPLALFAGALWQRERGPDTPLGNMDMNGVVTRNATDNAVDNTVGTDTTPPTRPGTVTYTIYVPNDDGKLQRKTITEKAPSPSTNDATQLRNANRALELLFQNAPELFPNNTKLTNGGVKRAPGEEGNLWQVSLDQNFQQAEQWRSETITQVALGAIALTAESSLGASSPQIQILIDGKPIQTLGEYDVSDPISAREFNSLVAQG